VSDQSESRGGTRKGQVLCNGHVGYQGQLLKGSGYARLLGLQRAVKLHTLAKELVVTFIGLNHAAQYFDQRGFASAVFSQDGMH